MSADEPRTPAAPRGDRDRAESEKLDLEIEDLRRPWYKRPVTHLSAAIAASAVVGVACQDLPSSNRTEPTRPDAVRAKEEPEQEVELESVAGRLTAIDQNDDEARQARVVRLLTEQLGVSESDVAREATLIDDLGADSLDLIELVMGLEEEFDVEITDQDADRLLTVGDIFDFVQTF